MWPVSGIRPLPQHKVSIKHNRVTNDIKKYMAIENDMICNRSTQFVAYSYIFLFFILCSFLSLMADLKNSIAQIALFSQNSNIGGNRRFMSLAPISLAPHLIDTPPIGPTHWSPTKLFDLKGPNFFCDSPIYYLSITQASFGLRVMLFLCACTSCVHALTPCLSTFRLVTHSGQDHQIWTKGAKQHG